MFPSQVFLDEAHVGVAQRLSVNAARLNTLPQIRQDAYAPSDSTSGAMKTPSSDKMNMSAFDEGAIFSSLRRDSEEWSAISASKRGDPGADGCNRVLLQFSLIHNNANEST